MVNLVRRNSVHSYQNSIFYNENANPRVVNTFSKHDYYEFLPDSTQTFLNNTNWKQILLRGGNASYPYQRVRYISARPVRISAETRTKNGFELIVGKDRQSYINPTYIPNSIKDDLVLKDRALGIMKRKLRQNTGQAQLGAPLAQAKELHSLVRHALDLTGDVLNALLELKRTKGLSAFRFASDQWLNFNFGIAPTIKDIHDSGDALAKYFARRDHGFPITGTSRSSWISGLSKQPGITGAFNAPFSASYSSNHSLSYQYHGAFFLKVSAGNDYSVLQHLGLDWSELPAIGWELIPFSWVADYFGTIGAYLEDVFYTPPGILRYLCCTTKYRVKTTISGNYVPSAGTVLVDQHIADGMVETLFVRREVLDTIPTLALRVKTLDEIGLRSLSKTLNLAALLLK